MLLDITLVLYRPDFDLLDLTLASLARERSSFRHLRILASAASTEEAGRIIDAIKTHQLSDLAIIDARSDNLGFAAGHNRLLELAFQDSADAVLVLNPDVQFAPGSIATFMEAVRDVGVERALFGPTLQLLCRSDLSESSVSVVDTAGIHWDSSGRHRDRMQKCPWPAREPETAEIVEGISGACLLVPVSAWREIVRSSHEFFDEMFLAYREDAELGIRAKKLGVPSFVVWVAGIKHARGTVGTQRKNPNIDALGVRNRLLLRYKLGRDRPGAWGLPTLRDIVAVVACLTVERTSLEALVDAWRVRRFMRYKGRFVFGRSD